MICDNISQALTSWGLAYAEPSWVSLGLLWAPRGPGHHFTTPNFVGVLFNFAGSYLTLGGPWSLRGFVFFLNCLAILDASLVALGSPKGQCTISPPPTSRGSVELCKRHLVDYLFFICLKARLQVVRLPQGGLLMYSEPSWVRLGYLWASQLSGHHFTVTNFVGVVSNFTGVLCNFGRAPDSWARWGGFLVI